MPESFRPHVPTAAKPVPSARPVAAIRNAIIAAETQLGAINISIEQVRRELASLEGFSLGGVLSGLLGKKAVVVPRLHEQLEALQQNKAETDAALTRLRSELDSLGESIHESHSKSCTGSCTSQDECCSNASGATQPTASPAGPLAAIQRAMDAGDDAMKALREEIETASSLGRGRHLEKNMLMRAMMNGARRGATRECASRVTSAMARFQRSIEAAVKSPELASVQTLHEAAMIVSGLVGAAEGTTFAATMTSSGLDTVHTQLQTAAMLVEKAYNTIRGREIKN